MGPQLLDCCKQAGGGWAHKTEMLNCQDLLPQIWESCVTKMLTDASHRDKLLNCPNLTGCKMPENVLACKGPAAFYSHITAGYI